MKAAALPAERRNLEYSYLVLSYRSTTLVAQALEQRSVAGKLLELEREVERFLQAQPDNHALHQLARQVEPVLREVASLQQLALQPAQFRDEFRRLYLDLEGLGGLLGYPRR
ncbi:MAG: hypothetical protein NTV70_21840 [Acidobacteria bacterium]|nr:hypothetical protein [Acidobacteriota bacterium]